jgi:hypothetical protein
MLPLVFLPHDFPTKVVVVEAEEVLKSCRQWQENKTACVGKKKVLAVARAKGK